MTTCPVEGTGDFGRSSFHLACERGQYSLALQLIARGADVSPVSPFDGATPLHAVCQRPTSPGAKCAVPEPYLGSTHWELIKLIVSSCSIDQRTHMGYTPLHYLSQHSAPSSKSLPFFRLLLGKGADPNSRTPFGINMDIIEHEDNIRKYPAVEGVPFVRLPGGSTSLHIACARGNEPVVAVLLEYGARADDRNGEGWMAVHAALTSLRPPSSNMIKLLIDHGADVNSGAQCAGISNVVPLNIALLRGCAEVSETRYLEIVSLLLHHGAFHGSEARDSNPWKLNLGINWALN